jgi:hypothetical protein
MSTSALLFTIGLLRGSESSYVDQLATIIEISYVFELLFVIPFYLFFRAKDINGYLAYAACGGAIGGVSPFAMLVPCALSPKGCGVVNIGFLSLSALGLLFGVLSAIVFRAILGKHKRLAGGK